ncbi:cytochrome c oxidase assembly factor 3, mitochondrial-like [Penaeus japonicus]|uniref:cytochrome c oxidase assembly factor 3, mitochondrial-like n=1 Tax=Penaeus japonicus TaxID=27405 RepID=UPI001C70B97B|nr:cytochrome c oxidase assembly factor 3, mitochondrial-like [Penaeus japonicus]XP_042873609.1 cytochrome c oxidase assembly factor 3, mitochondrial-like [Penaeus japonicus]
MAGEGRQMPKLDLQKDIPKLSQAQIDYMKIVENQNVQRVQKLALQRRNNIAVGCLLGVGVLGIYTYSIYSVKQEKFLDELE